MKVLARAEKGREFFYLASSAHAVPASRAEAIRDALNRSGYGLMAGEVWHLFDVGPYDTAYEYAQYQSFRIRSGKLYDKSMKYTW